MAKQAASRQQDERLEKQQEANSQSAYAACIISTFSVIKIIKGYTKPEKEVNLYLIFCRVKVKAEAAAYEEFHKSKSDFS